MDKIVVSCFYLIEPKPGRSHKLYKLWFQNLISNLNTKIIIFTDNKSKEFLDTNNKNIIYQILPFEELYYYKKYGLDFWENQQKKDPNLNRKWQLSVLYNEKCRFIEKAMQLYQKTEWFIWCDAGCFRKKIEISFPVISHLNSSRMTLLLIKKFTNKELDTNYIFHSEQQVRLGGGVQIATKKVWLKWIFLYDQVFKEYAKKSSVNCDQGLLATVAIKNNELVDLIKSKKTKITKDKWFYLLEYCSSSFLVKKKKKWKFWNFL
ncbi:WlaTC/HtrL family glycosyltransferase [Polaribacter sp. 11A2H]|uniref:WlaTC/HtrL family glycosyltransferase n=1 Tax=Polaribacter sp. 11A2H TaxID=2687290 RepID=UPI00140B30DB|nr:WlaTC/HtrL family glycosyltransferase [Polaribacter sp. 11A2H]